MNKKKLSVVMAGAMLATSVAPVLAAETTGTEIANNQLKAFKKQILAKMAEKKISDFAIFKEESNKFVSGDIQDELAANSGDEFSSAYGIKITGKDGIVKLPTTYTTDAKTLENALDALVAGDKVEVFERETTDFAGQLLPGSGIKAISDPVAYNKDEADPFTNDLAQIKKDLAIYDGSSKYLSKIVSDANISKDGDLLKVITNKTTTSTGSEKVELKYKATDNKLDGRLAYDANNKLLDATNNTSVQSFDHFGELVEWEVCAEAPDKKATVVETYTIGEEATDATREALKVSDLFDGIVLTEKGTEIVADLKNAKDAFDKEGTATDKALVQLDNRFIDNQTSNNFKDAATSSTGVYKFTIAYYKNGALAKAAVDAANATDLENTKKAAEKLITVTSTDAKELEGLYNILKANDFRVGRVAGQNRYETAVNVAKQQNLDVATNKGIVLVNGESLVDGLAAAPLAATKKAPLLLSQNDKLPTATKEYIEAQIAELGNKEKKAITVYLVGGKTVLSNSLVNEIEEMGLKVERVGGENREATSLAVAKVINPTKAIKKAFVVGANGEADAMSISAVAVDSNLATTDADVTPIIVSKVGGVTSETTDYLRENGVNDVTIVGGEKVVSEADEAKINKALTGVKAVRLAGKNRIETNIAVINKYYTSVNTKGVVAVKDGIADKGELIDALSAANYAASIKAPIVLASTTVTDAQKSTLLKTTSSVDKVVQVGLGAERTVLETIANLLGVTNKVK